MGTQANNNDTYSDMLSDAEEIYVYGTDSLNCDTDGDTFTDGFEVEWGMNPTIFERSITSNIHSYRPSNTQQVSFLDPQTPRAI